MKKSSESEAVRRVTGRKVSRNPESWAGFWWDKFDQPHCVGDEFETLAEAKRIARQRMENESD